jgi:hypothetical protein
MRRTSYLLIVRYVFARRLFKLDLAGGLISVPFQMPSGSPLRTLLAGGARVVKSGESPFAVFAAASALTRQANPRSIVASEHLFSLFQIS